MSKLEILTEPNPLLHEKCKKVKIFDDKLKKLAAEMAETLYDNYGTIGLAAPQVGKLINMIAIEFDPKRYFEKDELKECKEKPIPFTILINPRITWHSKEKETANEGCMSLPDIELPVERYKEINVLAEDINGNKIKVRAKNYFARVIQHEIDHLNGILLTDVSKTKLGRIVFLGTPKFASIVLTRLIRSPYKPYLIISEADKPAGRGNKIKYSPVKIMAQKEKIELWQPNRISESLEKLTKLKPDMIIVAAYGQIIPKYILDTPKFGALNVHPSLLPKYRGASPIQNAILYGDKTTGVTIIKMDEKMDHGPIISQTEFTLNNITTTPALIKNLAYIGANLLVKTIPLYLLKELKPIPQKHANATFTKLLKKEDGKINWNKSIHEIDRQIRAFNPWPGSYTIIDKKRLKICKSHIENDKLIIDKVQPEGKNIMNFKDFLNGYKKTLDFGSKIN